MTPPLYVSTANTGNSITKYHLRESCPCLEGSIHRPIDADAVERRDLELCGQCERLYTDKSDPYQASQDWSAYRSAADAPTECRECGTDLGAGYLCDDCDTAEGWPEE